MRPAPGAEPAASASTLLFGAAAAGTERCEEAVSKLGQHYDIVINIQVGAWGAWEDPPARAHRAHETSPPGCLHGGAPTPHPVQLAALLPSATSGLLKSEEHRLRLTSVPRRLWRLCLPSAALGAPRPWPLNFLATVGPSAGG